MSSKPDTLPTFSVTSLTPGDGAGNLLRMALNDFGGRSIVGSIVLLTSLGWVALLASAPMALVFVCRGTGIASLTPAWDLGRAAALMAMWGMMSCVMMLPCATVQIVDASRALGQREGVYKTAFLFSSGYLCVVAALGIGGAIAEWILESTGAIQDGSVIGDPFARSMLVVVAGLVSGVALWRASIKAGAPRPECADTPVFSQGLRHGWSRLGACLAMICLQFAAGAMNMPFMAALAVWMFAASIRQRSALFSGLAGMALLSVAGLLFFGNLS